MRERKSQIASAANDYFRGKAAERKLREAALNAIRLIAAGCIDPAGRAQRVLDLEASLSQSEGTSKSFSSNDTAEGPSGAEIRQ
jgi:hypothetical protein